MKKEDRKVLLFLDNAPSHPTQLKLENVKVQFLPPNTTSHCQPMDQGIIQAMKLKFRKKQLQYLLSAMDKHPELTGPHLLKLISVLDAIYWVKNSWNEIEQKTITKCFNKCGFIESSSANSESTDDDDSLDDLPLSVFKLTKDIFGCDFKELLKIDREVVTCDSDLYTDWDKPAKEILAEKAQESDEDEGETEEETTQMCTLTEAQDYIQRIKKLAAHLGDSDLLN